MDDKREKMAEDLKREALAKDLVLLAKELMKDEVKTAAKRGAEVDASDTDELKISPEDEKEDEAFTQKVTSIRPQALKRLNKFRNKKVRQLASKFGISWNAQNAKLNDVIDLLNALIAKA